MNERRDGAADPNDLGQALWAELTPYLTETVYLFDREGALKARLGPPEGTLGYGAQAGTNVFRHVHPDDAPRGMRIGAEAQDAQPGWRGETVLRLRHADGDWRRYRLRFHNCYRDPALGGMVVTIHEVVEGSGPDEGPWVELESVADELPTAYVALGQQGVIRYASSAAADLLRARREELVGLPVEELVVDQDKPMMAAAYASLRTAVGARTVLATTRSRFANRIIEAEFHTRGTDSDNKVVTVVLVDQSEETELVRLATRDALTGLANRTRVIQTITGSLLPDDPVLSVVYVDLDDLKSINDVHGHDTGDRALVAVAQRLGDLVRPTDLVGRMSGDEFVIVCPGLAGTALMEFVQRIGDRTAGDHAVEIPDGEPIAVTVSAGGATAVPGDSTASLLRRADEAMFEAKRRH